MSTKLQDYKILDAKLVGSDTVVFRLEDNALVKVVVSLDQVGIAIDANGKPIYTPQTGFQYHTVIRTTPTIVPADKKFKAPAPSQPPSTPPDKTYG